MQSSALAHNNDVTSFHLGNEVRINLMKAKAKDFYWLIINKTYNDKHSGPQRWDITLNLAEEKWSDIFNSVRNISKKNKMKEFHLKSIHSIVVTKKELHKFGIKTDDKCIYCGEQDSIDHTFLEYHFTQRFTKTCLSWFNDNNNANFTPNKEELLFGIFNNSMPLLKKFNRTLLFIKRHIYTRKLNEEALFLSDFITKIKFKYRIEKLSKLFSAVKKQYAPSSIYITFK